MYIKRIGFFLLLFNCAFFNSFAQDIHFSQVNRQPLYQNPGNTGDFKGDIRLMLNYKEQWRSVTVPFRTTVIGADFKLKKQGINLGAFLFNDDVGDGKLRTIETLLSASKTFKITSDSSHIITPGLAVGINFRQIDFDKLYFDNQFNGVNFDPTLATNELLATDNRLNVNTSLGFTHKWLRAKDEFLTSGLSFHNLNRPNQGFFGATVSRDIRVSLFSVYQVPFKFDFRLKPGLGINFQGKYREFLVGSQVQYILEDRLGKYKAVDGGIWFRGRDAIIVRVGAEIQTWSVAVSYDTNISKLVPASNLRGGIEFSVHYTIQRFKPEKVIHRICPDYI